MMLCVFQGWVREGDAASVQLSLRMPAPGVSHRGRRKLSQIERPHEMSGPTASVKVISASQHQSPKKWDLRWFGPAVASSHQEEQGRAVPTGFLSKLPMIQQKKRLCFKPLSCGLACTAVINMHIHSGAWKWSSWTQGWRVSILGSDNWLSNFSSVICTRPVS